MPRSESSESEAHTTRSEWRGRERAERRFGIARACLVVALPALLLAAPAARALTLADITPLYFQPAQGQGFDPAAVAAAGLSADLSASSTDLFLGAGGPSSGAPVQVVSQNVTEVHQLPSSATPEDPAIVDSTWTIENVSAGALMTPVLLFTTLDPLDTYPGDPLIGLDAGLLDLLTYTPASGPALVYGAVVLPDLAQGESTEILVRYVVGGPLDLDGASQVLAPLGLAVAVTYTSIPEPSTLALYAVGLAGIAAGGRWRGSDRVRTGGGRSRENAGCPSSRRS